MVKWWFRLAAEPRGVVAVDGCRGEVVVEMVMLVASWSGVEMVVVTRMAVEVAAVVGGDDDVVVRWEMEETRWLWWCGVG
ncbi:hypothetical protein Tco_1015640 [Tanacetum coccineum]|uniref:Uncharacterized protein n=1 Tax=Tanacetum coccineum TaxID=301880 RepID=A0ABQ5FLD2_9ASTR